jgi:protein disulfide-isomerase
VLHAPQLARACDWPETPTVKALRSLLLLLSFAAFISTAPAEGKPGWLTDFQQAQEQAKTSKKLILVDFTGSDWCGWCIKLDREVFSKPEFKEYASKNLVLMEVDFPRAKQLSPSEKSQNQQLAQEHGIQGFPTIIVLNSDGKKVGELSYEAGIPDGSRETRATPEAFIASLEKLRKS